MRRVIIVVVTLLAFGAAACGPKYVTPPQVPERLLPQLPQDPPPQPYDTGRIVIDVTNGPTKVEEILAKSSGFATSGGYSAASYGESTKHLCTSPCVVDLPYGSHEIRIGGDVVTVDAGVKPTAYRHTTGYMETHTGAMLGGILALSFGLSGVVTGGALAAVGIDAGVPILVVSGILSAIGGWLMKKGRTVIQPGSGQQWVIGQ